jgi:hypothetical protein
VFRFFRESLVDANLGDPGQDALARGGTEGRLAGRQYDRGSAAGGTPAPRADGRGLAEFDPTSDLANLEIRRREPT